ncbi:MAG: hypothetical protein PHD51_04550 [Patescibacteria group bacterium]|nr:hypothetical protein [Patescibacteria group bacterium]MDD5490799.1 hypothetical protein [Patescibacteria group bacterium]
MPLNTLEQVSKNIDKSNRSLIAFRRDYNGDALASSLGLAKILKKMGKNADIVCDGFNYPSQYKFLPSVEQIQPSLSQIKKITLALDIKGAPLNALDYEMKENQLLIHLTPQKENFDIQNIKTQSAGYKYDLIFTINTPDLNSIGKVYEDNADFFYYTPIINIDHLAQNESYGQINVIDIVSSSAAEIIFGLLEHIGKEYLDEEIATELLTGLITKTKSFRIPNVTPKTLNIAGQLLVAGGRREEIIKNLYHNKSINTLKLWGRALARLKHDYEKRLVWTMLSRQDFIASGAADSELMDVVYELIANSPEADVIIMFHEKSNGQICVHVYCEKTINSLQISRVFNPQGTQDLAQFVLIGKNLAEAEREVIQNIKQFI